MNAFLLQLEQPHLDQSKRMFYPSLELWELSSPGLQAHGELEPHSWWDMPPSVFAWAHGVWGKTPRECGRGGMDRALCPKSDTSGHKHSLGCNRDGPGVFPSLHVALIRKKKAVLRIHINSTPSKPDFNSQRVV